MTTEVIESPQTDSTSTKSSLTAKSCYWLNDNVQVIDGWCWTSGFDGRPVWLGETKDIVEVFKTRKIPKETNKAIKVLLEALLKYEKEKQGERKPIIRTNVNTSGIVQKRHQRSRFSPVIKRNAGGNRRTPKKRGVTRRFPK